MSKLLDYLEPIWLDDKGEVSGKRILAILSILSGIFITNICVVAYIYFIKIDFTKAQNMDLSQIAILIAPLFANGALLWGVTSYFQNKKDELNANQT